MKMASVSIHPETTTEIEQDAYKNNAAAFALRLAQHGAFEAATTRTITPPPSYSRHAPRQAPPRLTLSIPDGNGQLPETRTPTTVLSGTEILGGAILESTENSPNTQLPSTTDLGRLNKLKTGLRKRRNGFRDKIRQSSFGSRSSSASTSPHDLVSFSPLPDIGIEAASIEMDASQTLNVIHELDSQPVSYNGPPNQTNGHNSPRHSRRVSRVPSLSSIVPTPSRGLSVLASSERQTTIVDPNELSSRLSTLERNKRREQPEVTISPCSPTSVPAWTADGQFSLLRSNAITDNVHSNEAPTSPLSPLPRSMDVPPSSPTLDGRLDRLPRLATPTVMPTNQSPIRQGKKTPRQISFAKAALVASSDSGKELVVRKSTRYSRLLRPFSMPSRREAQSHNHVVQREVEGSAMNAPEVVPPEDATRMQSSSQNLDKYLQQYHEAIWRAQPHTPPSSFSTLIGTICEATASAVVAASEILKSRYGPEPPVPEEHLRVRWKCACGEHVYDDYIEHRPGAAAELEAHLNGVPKFWVNSPSSSHPSSAASSIFSAGIAGSPLSSASSWSSQGPSSPKDYRQNMIPTQPTRLLNSAYGYNVRPYIEPLWLYTCVNEGKWTTKMRHLDVNASKISSDKDLALALGALYAQVNRRWYSFLKLRGLLSIKFVQFELHRNRYADISLSPSLPSPHTPNGSTYEFTPHDLSPPVGSNYLMHLFKHPEDYDNELITYLRTPKRRDRLEIGTGWGLELVEGFLVERVLGALIALFLVASLVVGVSWACGKGDMQGAFGVAGWIIAGGGLVGVWVQAVVG